MNLQTTYDLIDTLIPDNFAGIITAATLRQNLKQIALQLYTDSNSITGWSPVITPVADGSRIVLKITDWAGGQGPKPAVTGQFLKTGGYAIDAATATDIRGSAGAAGANGPGTITRITAPDDGQPPVRYWLVATLPAPTGGTYDFLELQAVLKPWVHGATADGQIRLYCANRESFYSEYTRAYRPVCPWKPIDSRTIPPRSG